VTNSESVADDKAQWPGSDASAAQAEVASDDDWKSRVKAEDAALDQQFREQPAGAGGAGVSPTETATRPTSPEPEQVRGAKPQPSREMPAPTFADLVGLLSAQAMMFLGLIPNPATQKAETQLPTARYFIDMISILEDKTAGQLTKEESQVLGNTLHELRMTYMQRSKQSA
jgi:hypothetical protein